MSALATLDLWKSIEPIALAPDAVQFVEGILSGHADRFPALRSAFNNYWRWQRRLNPARRALERASGQEAWALTGLAQHQRAATAAEMAALAPEVRSYFASVSTLVDLGCGDGRATSSFIAAIRPFSPIETVRLVDQNPKAIRGARSALTSLFGDLVSVESVQADVVNLETWCSKSVDRTVALASGCLHELTAGAKVAVLRRIRGVAALLILVEFLVDHETPNSGSIELIVRSASFYEALVHDALRTVRDQQLCRQIVGGFLLAEMVDIWAQPYILRRNYHRDLRGWNALLCEAGFDVLLEKEVPTVYSNAVTGIFLGITANDTVGTSFSVRTDPCG